MASSAFVDKSHQPTATELDTTLGRSHVAWSKLIALVDDQLGDITPVWAFSGKSTGWGLRLVRRGRVILYMTPQQSHFLVSFVLGERAVAAAGAARLPLVIQQAIDAAPRYAEGRGVRIPIRSAAHVSALTRLAQIKHDN